MYYEVYIDVLFMVNFMMDYLLLLIECKVLKCPAGHGNICIGAALGAFLTCLVVAVGIPAFMKLILFHVVINVFMIRTGLKIRFGREFLKAYVMLYICGFLLGGVFGYLHQYVKTVSLFFVLAVISYYLVLGCMRVLSWMQRFGQYHCKVDLYFGETKNTVEAFIDTGNSLRDEVTGCPVCVLEKKSAGFLMNAGPEAKLHYIPYHTVGKEAGILPVLRIDKMCVRQEKEYWIERPVIGICEEDISAGGGYQMILNPDLF